MFPRVQRKSNIRCSEWKRNTFLYIYNQSFIIQTRVVEDLLFVIFEEVFYFLKCELPLVLYTAALKAARWPWLVALRGSRRGGVRATEEMFSRLETEKGFLTNGEAPPTPPVAFCSCKTWISPVLRLTPWSFLVMCNTVCTVCRKEENKKKEAEIFMAELFSLQALWFTTNHFLLCIYLLLVSSSSDVAFVLRNFYYF